MQLSTNRHMYCVWAKVVLAGKWKSTQMLDIHATFERRKILSQKNPTRLSHVISTLSEYDFSPPGLEEGLVG